MEVNEAYELLSKKSTADSATRNADAYGGTYTGTGSSYSGPNSGEFLRARAFINQGNLQAAKAGAGYYSYPECGMVLFCTASSTSGKAGMTRQTSTSPLLTSRNRGNAEYANAYNTLRHTGNPYSRAAGRGGYDDCTPCSLCVPA